ncbi:MAG: hypothetical protein PVJ02_04460 [Gemmatimonadota bacterium]|jgi:hypothetical protein
MTHLDEGRLLALRDGAGDAEAEAHLHECASCRRALEALGARRTEVADALSTLDETWDLGAARAAVRARVQKHDAEAPVRAKLADGPVRFPDQPKRRRTLWWGLSRAAGLLLVTAAAAYALPGSPVRSWVDGALGRIQEDETYVSPPAPAPDSDPAPSEATGIRIDVSGGALRVVLRDAAPGTDVQVRWVPGTESAVFAPVGSRFTSAEGRIEARLTPGPVSVELPRDVSSVVLRVGDRTYLQKSDAGIDVEGPTLSRSEDEVVFRIPKP